MVTHTSRIARANKDKISLRTTIPQKIVEDLGLTTDDTLSWNSFVDKEHKRKVAQFRKLE